MLPTCDLVSAQRAAEAGTIEHWIHAYLASGDWANPGLSAGLRIAQRWWRGPLLVPLVSLERCCGPEATMEYRMEPAAWEQRVAAIAGSLTTRERVPPLIVEYRAGTLSVRDGNHRLAAMERVSWSEGWIIVWYNSAADDVADQGREGSGHRM
jgi:hypothetical protein